jgi:hypothetical protein
VIPGHARDDRERVFSLMLKMTKEGHPESFDTLRISTVKDLV